MGSPSSGSKVQTTMSVTSKGNLQLLVSSSASLQLEKLEKPSSSEKPSSGATNEEQSIAAFLGDKKMKRRTRSSQGLELNGVSLRAEVTTSLRSLSFRGLMRSGSGSVTPKASESPRAKGRSTSPGADKYAVAKIAASLFQSPTKLERSMSLSRVVHRVVPGADGRSRTGVSDVTLPDERDTLAELKQHDAQRELQSRLQAVVAHNGFVRDSCCELLEKELEGSGAPAVVTGDLPFANGNYEYSHCKGKNFFENACLLGSIEDSLPNGSHLAVKDIHDVRFETTNKLHTSEQVLAMPLATDRDLYEIASSCLLSPVASPQLPLHLFRSSDELTAYKPLHSKLQSGVNLSNGTDGPEDSLRIDNITDLKLSTSNSCSAGMELSYLDAEVTLPRTCETFQTKVLVPEGSQHVVADASQGKVVDEIHFGAEREVESGACLRKSASFELQGEKKSKIRKRRRSVSASGIGAMLLKIVRTSEAEPPGTKSLPRAESEPSDTPPPSSISPHKGTVQSGTESPNQIEAVDMDIEYEDCSSELVAAADLDIACNDARRVEDFSEPKQDTTQPSEEAQLLQLVANTQLRIIENCTERGQSSELEVRDSQDEDQIAGSGSGSSFKDECDNRVISLENVEPELLDERFLDARDKSLDRCNSFELIERSSPSAPTPQDACHHDSVMISTHHEPVLKGNGRMNGHKGGDHIIEDCFGGGSQRRRRPGSRARLAHNHLDSSATVAMDDGRRSLSLVDENLCMIASLERSRSFASMLQVSPRQSVDESTTHSRLAPSSIAILTNPSFSSSHQDRLWEEQAEYSSGGRGTPGREEEDDHDDNNAVFELHTPSPGDAISPADDVQTRSASASLRIKGQGQDISCSASDEKRKGLGQLGRKRGRPQRSPLRSLLAAEDLYEKRTSALHHHRRRRPFLQQILFRIRGGKSSSPGQISSPAPPKRRQGTLWSTCMCFSHVK